MTAIRVTESSGSVGILQISDGYGGFSPSNILFSTGSSGIAKSILLGSDVAVFISGASNCKNTTRAGAALFGGDVVVSGTLYAERQVIEVDELVDGDLFITGSLVASQDATINGTLSVEDLSSSTSKILILSGGAATSTNEGGYPDVNFFVSGSQGSAGTSTRGTALFGGDVVISGTLHGGSPLKIAGGMEVAGATDFADALNFAAAPTFASGFVVTGSTAYNTAPTFDAGFNVASGQATFAAAPKFSAGFQVTGSTAYDTAPRFDAGFNVAGGQASFTSAPSFSAGFQLTGSGDISGSVNIGQPEDGTYSDGLFTDIGESTVLGTVVDRFNEVLKALAPGPAPSLDDIDHNNSSVSGKLSFGASNSITSYTAHSTAAGFSAVDVDGTFGSSTSGNNLRIGLLNGSTSVTGDLNEDVSADTHSSGQVNYPANSFGDADSGTLKLYVNGSLIHSVDLSSFGGSGNPGSGAGSSLNGNGSGFTNLSVAAAANFSDGTDLDLFKHRTGRYIVTSANQRLGWNYAQVIHSLTSGDVTTNYVEWINDSDNNALSAAGSAFDTLSMTGDLGMSGVKYHTGGSAQYRVRVTNAYKNVYSTSNITFTETNCTIPNQSMPSSGNDEDKVIHLTGSATINANSLLNQSIAASVNVSHPLKSNLSGGGSQTISGLLMWAYSNNSTVLSETFRRENYRIISGTYANQASVTDAGNTWSGTVHMSGSGGHANGLMFYNQRLYAPKQGANSSNFGGISNGPAGNVDYSGITSGLRTFYRYFQNNSGGSKTGFSLTINGSGTIVGSGTALNATRLRVFVKLPTTGGSQATGWMDLTESFSTGQVGDNDGCLEGSLDSSLNATNTVTFGTQFAADDEYIVIRVEADASFTGYISQMTVSWS